MTKKDKRENIRKIKGLTKTAMGILDKAEKCQSKHELDLLEYDISVIQAEIRRIKEEMKDRRGGVLILNPVTS